MIKVLIVIARLNRGGTARYIEVLSDGLRKSNCNVVIATGHVQGNEIEYEGIKNISVVRLKYLGRKIKLIDDFRARNEIRRLIDEYQPDLIYSHTFKAGLLTRTIKTKIPNIHAFHGHLLHEPELRGFKIRIAMAIERKLAPKSKFLVTVGENVATELLAAGVGKESQYVSIPPGVRNLRLTPKTKVLKSLNLQVDERPIVAWLARVVPVKRPDRVITLAQEIPEARFIIAGGGDLLDRIKSEAPENLSVLGWQSASDIWSIADIAISTSENEGMPISLIEAQLAGLPAISTNVGSVSEVIDNGHTGFVLNQFDYSYVSIVKKLVLDKHLQRKLGEAARKRSQKKFAPARLVQDHLNLFRRAI